LRLVVVVVNVLNVVLGLLYSVNSVNSVFYLHLPYRGRVVLHVTVYVEALCYKALSELIVRHSIISSLNLLINFLLLISTLKFSIEISGILGAYLPEDDVGFLLQLLDQLLLISLHLFHCLN